MSFIVNESEPLTYILGAVTMLMALVLAWRGYRHLAREDEERRKAKERRDGR
jgi:predicted tellurium resistance membrane protein TerC